MNFITFISRLELAVSNYGASIDICLVIEMVLYLISSTFADSVMKWLGPYCNPFMTNNDRTFPGARVKRKQSVPDTKRSGQETSSKIVKRQRRLIWHPPKPRVPISQQRAQLYIEVIDDKLPKNWGSINGKRPRDFGPIRKPSERLPERLQPSPIQWFDTYEPKIHGWAKGKKKDPALFSTPHGKFRTYPLRIGEFEAEVLDLQKRIDLCLKSSCWSDVEIPKLMYVSMRKSIVGIARSFYGDGCIDLQRTLGSPGGTICQLVKEALSASKLMNILQDHFVDHPSFGYQPSKERELISMEESMKANVKSEFPVWCI